MRQIDESRTEESYHDMTAEILTWSGERDTIPMGSVACGILQRRIIKGATVDPKFEWKKTGPCSAIEGDNGCGYVASTLAMERL